ncbi:MAG: DUF3365 domain-containing protein [Chitinophagales bacterium]|nr:DUF3365 domain-containing protein [Chitinophagales bacterium]
MKKIIVISPILVMMLAFVLKSCTQANNNEVAVNVSEKSETYYEGLKIVDQNCITCHLPKAGMDNRIAPPLFAVKQHYYTKGMQETEFIKNMTDFLLSPKIEHSKMPNAIEKFGLMPNLGMNKEQYEAVALYIYRAELEKPGWFEEHHKKEMATMMQNAEEGTEDYLKKGMNIALATKAELGKNLLNAIQTKGTDKALDFCNEKAIVLTDSMANELGAKIKRVSDKNRNPNNVANEQEQAYITLAKAAIAQNGKATPKVFEENGKMVGYYPITTNAMCLQCHGNIGTDINEKTLAAINQHYPNDKATGYASDELRGIWVVEMGK